MTGTEHYREAERLIHQAVDGDYGDEPYRARLAAAAQVHATLALAAATGERTAAYPYVRDTFREDEVGDAR